MRDLRQHIEPDLSFRKQIIETCKKAFQNLGFVLRQTNIFYNAATVKALYNALVRSRLEFGAIIWNPHETKYNLMIEKIQNKFTRYLYLKEYGVYPFYPLMYPTLFVLGMVGYTKLEVRRNLALATYVFKVLRGMLHNPGVLESLALVAPCGPRRRAPRLLARPVARTNLLANAPIVRAINMLNQLSTKIDLFNCTLTEFTKAASRQLCFS